MTEETIDIIRQSLEVTMNEVSNRLRLTSRSKPLVRQNLRKQLTSIKRAKEEFEKSLVDNQ